MCKVIDADCVLANMFALGREEVTVRELNLFRERVEKAVANIFIDVSGDTICLAVDQHPDMFEWCDEIIKRVNKSNDQLFRREYVDKYFNWRIPAEARGAFWDACQTETH